MTQATFAGPTSRLYAFLQSLPAILSGQAPDPYGLAHKVAEKVSKRLLELIRGAFWQKAGGLRGDDGVKWAPHAKSTRQRRGQFALIGYEHGELFRSLMANPVAGRIIVEALSKHATFFHRGTRHMPARPLWPQRLPRPWMDELLAVAREAVAEAIDEVIERGQL